MVAALGLALCVACTPEDGPPRIPFELNLIHAFQHAVQPMGVAGPPPSLRGNVVALPANSRVSAAVRIPERGRIEFGRVVVPEWREALLRLTPSAGERGENWNIDPSDTISSIDLSDWAGRVVLLEIVAESETGARGAGPVEITAPRLIGVSDDREPTSKVRGKRPNIVLYLIDTLRPDHLGVYGYDRDTSPAIDAFSAKAVVFDDAIAQAPWTKTSVASIFTGLRGPKHRVLAMNSVLPPDARTLAELLKEAGYQTGGVVANGLVNAEFGFGQGFDFYTQVRGRVPGDAHDGAGDGPFESNAPAIDSDLTQAAVWPWLDRIDEARPFFLYVHTLDPHAPHHPPEPFRSRFASNPGVGSDGDMDAVELGSMATSQLFSRMSAAGVVPKATTRRAFVDLYDAEIAHNDAQFGLFLAELDRRGRLDDTLIVLVSDHGEAFWEHELYGHGNTLYDEVLRIPLVIRAPGARAGARASTRVQHVDVLPTLVDYAGVYVFEPMDGTSLRPLLEGTDFAGADRTIRSNGSMGATARYGQFKLVQSVPPLPTTRLYDVRADPGEERDIAADHPIMTRYLLETLARDESWARKRGAAPTRALTPEMQTELKALGYVE